MFKVLTDANIFFDKVSVHGVLLYTLKYAFADHKNLLRN